jgi:hypothetical protein
MTEAQIQAKAIIAAALIQSRTFDADTLEADCRRDSRSCRDRLPSRSMSRPACRIIVERR